MCRLVAIRHCSARKIDMQIYAQILVISLARPAALATTARRVCAIYCRRRRRHPRSFDLSLFFSRPLLATPSYRSRLLSLRVSLSLSSHPLVSLYHPVCDARFSSKYAFFSFRRAPVLRAGSRACDDGRARGRSDAERWVRGYKTGLARV